MLRTSSPLRRFTATCGLLVYSLVMVVAPLLDARVHAPEQAVQFEADGSAPPSPGHDHDGCGLCRIQSTVAVVVPATSAVLVSHHSISAAAPAAADAPVLHTAVLPLGARAPPVS